MHPYPARMRPTETTRRVCAIALGSLVLVGAAAGCTGEVDQGPIGGEVRPTGSSRFPRLSHAQWQNAVQDLLVLDAPPDAPGPVETTSGIFNNVSSQLSVTGALWMSYRDASETMARNVASDPAALARILPEGLPASGPERARGFIEGFGLRAYRRPLTDAEVTAYLAMFDAAAPNYSLPAFEAGVAQVVATMLQSPNFLYRVERSTTPSTPERIPLDGYEIATRLSFALWETMPDQELLDAAASGELGTEEGVRAQATRMLADSRTDAVILRFHHLLLQTGTYGPNIMTRNSGLFPEFTPDYPASMVGEVDAFLRDVVIDRDLGLEELLTAPYTFADARIAGLYGQSVSGDAFQRIDLDPTERAGLLTMTGFLARNATPNDTDPIHRGVFVARRIVCADLPAPPNVVPAIPADPTGMLSMRERVQAHTSTAACANCHHRIINPLGFPFERFDALGRVQETELRTNATIDTTGDYLLDGTSVHYEDAASFAALLATSPQVHSCYGGHLAEYLFADRPIRRTLATSAGDVSIEGGSTRDVILSIVTDELFRTRPTATYLGPAATVMER